MLKVIRRLSSLKLTLAGMVLLGVGAALSYGNPASISVWVLIVPLGILALNLSAAILTNPHINQQPGLLLFHICLLSIVILVGVGRLTHLDAHIELEQGAMFNPDRMLDVKAGPLHYGDADKIKFRQGTYTVNYDAGLRRGLTYNVVEVGEANGQWEKQVIGDDRPLVLENFRFYTSYNKGFTAIVTWISPTQPAVTGTINMPSYPMFEYKQDNRWQPANGPELKLWLQLDTGMNEEQAWVLDGSKAKGKLVVTVGEQRNELSPGESVPIAGGELRYEGLSTWMGYRIFYDPTIKWLFFVAVAGVLGLMHYFYRKINLQPWLEDPAGTPAADSKHEDDYGTQKKGTQKKATQKKDKQSTQPLQGKHA